MVCAWQRRPCCASTTLKQPIYFSHSGLSAAVEGWPTLAASASATGYFLACMVLVQKGDGGVVGEGGCWGRRGQRRREKT